MLVLGTHLSEDAGVGEAVLPLDAKLVSFLMLRSSKTPNAKLPKGFLNDATIVRSRLVCSSSGSFSKDGTVIDVLEVDDGCIDAGRNPTCTRTDDGTRLSAEDDSVAAGQVTSHASAGVLPEYRRSARNRPPLRYPTLN
ncbi:hypothetical protein LSAT2_002122 [Lamellibrachia satsuma]|nr:hypothetical protein LSAT2_002122 [Lamellibrachia satsuma]